ncbi:DNA/RNA non-specific endonuclease [Variovorax paradoxus]|uniref:DNA/RNA non-specific endonuclease n=1 Tax=Variovorax paradoxus TaxID=34073 RepID=UPI003ED0A07A
MSNGLERLRQFNQRVRERDPHLAAEAQAGVKAKAESTVILESMAPGAAPSSDLALESIIMRTQRPVLAIRNNDAVLEFEEVEDSKTWKDRLAAARTLLAGAIPAVGRIELTGSKYDWIGTGWLINESVLVTNRHVAEAFAMRKGQGFSFTIGMTGRRVEAAVDFLEEIDNDKQLVFKLLRPLFIQQAPGPDVSFFEVDLTSGELSLAKPITLATSVKETVNAAVIGYPAYDSRIPDVDLMERIYGKKYNKKRLAPGAVTKVQEKQILHDCTTLGGNSGSVVIDLDTGDALGLHFSGTFLTANYAVRADVVAKLYADFKSGRVLNEARKPPSRPSAVAASAAMPYPSSAVTMTIPLTVTLSFGNPCAPARAAMPPTGPVDDGSGDIAGEEARAEDYSDREGYQEDFLGDGAEVPLPSVEAQASDLLKYDNGDKKDFVLRYEHYSVVLSKKRRMCFFSAVNIDGKLSKKSARVAWKWDPRIPKEQQIMNECYGNPPKFSRGHMTRREDPGWGDAGTAKRGNEDSMHVTNTTPQMQAFNAPIWLALEDYALQHARDDDMKISVFTGPYFKQNDPVMYGVKIPRSFWKVIAFIHDETRVLCATGYEMSQVNQLQPEEEFVFGPFQSPQLGSATQVSIASIEQKAGLGFGGLADADPFAADYEAVDGGTPAPLLALEQIRFV